MKVWTLWHGGDSYGCPAIPEDLETFPSLARAVQCFEDRYHNRDGRTPCVENATMHVFFADPSDSRDPYPDREVTRGPRGGIRAALC